jgi:tRNA A-37 threonylcarbamoyl transferase component Bud32
LKNIECDRWDGGRLRVNRSFTETLRANGLTTFESLMNFQGGTVAKDLLRERTTTRFRLQDASGGEPAFYIKRHGPAPLKEYLKPWLRLRGPILGARHEWNAILRFRDAGIPTMTPVALGESGEHSFLVTRAIEGCHKLSEKVRQTLSERELRDLLSGVAQLARRMHAAGMHHQDFYLGHVLVRRDDPHQMYIIDLGRVRSHRRLARRWIVKDLGQFAYSASSLSRAQRLRFFKFYLGRDLDSGDRRLWRQVERKSEAIARHSRKNGL